MATIRQRGGVFEAVVKRKNLLAKPVSRTFDTEAQATEWAAAIEHALDQGIVPQTLIEPATPTIAHAVRGFIQARAVKYTEQAVLSTVVLSVGSEKLEQVTKQWALAWIERMKVEENLSPSTIQHRVGALRRCLDWAADNSMLPLNTLRLLPRGFATYNDREAGQAKQKGGQRKVATKRARRLEGDEEQKIRGVLAGQKREDRERPLKLEHAPALRLLFELALETCMRLSEMYTLEVSQVDLGKRTIFLDRTKNGETRQVPLTSVALKALRAYLKTHKEARLFPWWRGPQSEPKADYDERRRCTSQLSAQWRRIVVYARIEDLHFHDLRHEGTSRLFERTTLTDTEIQKITGHLDPDMLLVYANLRGSKLANKLW